MRTLIKALIVLACLELAFFGVVTLYALGGPTLFPSIYYSERNHVLAEIAKVPGVTKVKVYGNEDVTYEVFYVTFQLAGRPGTSVSLGISDNMTENAEHLYLEGVGPWSFRTKGHTYGEISNTHQKIRELSYGFAIDVGPAGDFAPLLPFKLSNVQDVIAHYDDLEKLFASWPDVNHVGKLTGIKNELTGKHDDTIEYYCDKAVGKIPYPQSWLDEIKQREATFSSTP